LFLDGIEEERFRIGVSQLLCQVPHILLLNVISLLI
jgi:hypothetical protein